MDKKLRKALIFSAAAMVLGLASFIAGMVLMAHGSAAVNEGGRNTTGGLGGFFTGLGIVMFLGTLICWALWALSESIGHYTAWKDTLTPQELAAVKAAETAALWGAAIGGHEAVKHYGHRVQQRYEDNNAAADLWQEKVAGWQAQQNGGAGQPGAQVQAPGQLGPWTEPTPQHLPPQGYWE